MKYLISLILLLMHSPCVEACECMNFGKTFKTKDDLAEYGFIAHVKIIETVPHKRDTADILHLNISDKHILQIIELFKGDSIAEIVDGLIHSSCDIGIRKGEEWIIFGYTGNDNEIYVQACDFNKQYRDADGIRYSKYGSGIYILHKLKEIYLHPIKVYGTEKRTDFYNNGQLEIEENYNNGKLSGARNIFYPNGVLMLKQFYINGTKDGESKWYYPSGQIHEEEYFVKGKQVNVERIYYDSAINTLWKDYYIKEFYKTEDSLKFVYHRIQVEYERIYNQEGNWLVNRHYTQLGKISEETFYDYKTGFNTTIKYQQNGNIAYISYKDKDLKTIYYQEFDENGFPKPK